MSQIIKKTPLPIAGLMLALASTGKLLAPYGPIYKNTFASVSFILFILLTLKILIYPRVTLESMNNPVVASVSPTYSMGAMLLSTYLKPLNLAVATCLWAGGLLLHLGLMVWFTRKFIVRFDIKKVFPSYFIVYVGLVMASITGPAYGFTSLGQGVFWFGFTAYLLLLVTVLYRLVKHPNLPEPAIPSITILAAPGSLCLAGYLSVFATPKTPMLVLLTSLSILIFLGVTLYLPRMLKVPFYPSYSAFTFPLAISAIAMKKASSHLVQMGISKGLVQTLVQVQEVMTVALVLYVLFMFIRCHYMKGLASPKLQTED